MHDKNKETKCFFMIGEIFLKCFSFLAVLPRDVFRDPKVYRGPFLQK